MLDPINSSDYSGQFSVGGVLSAINSYTHYLIGAGKTVVKSMKSFKWDRRAIAVTAAKRIKNTSGNGTYRYGDTNAACIAPLRVPVKPTDFGGRAVIGTGTGLLVGTLTVSNTGWSFHGKMIRVYDSYNFDTRLTSGSGVDRSFGGEASTILGAFGGFMEQSLNTGIVRPMDYNEILEGEIAINESGRF